MKINYGKNESSKVPPKEGQPYHEKVNWKKTVKEQKNKTT
jgi:hypothetical protein